MTGIVRFTSQEAEELSGGTPSLPTSTWSAAGLMLVKGAFGVRYIPMAPVSVIVMSEGVILGVRVGL